jgi:nucleoid-associated protein YgaU
MSSPLKMVKARLEEVGGAGSLEFKFNPTEYSVRKSAKWNIPARNMKGKAGAKPEFLGTDPQTISMQILFDDWESAVGDVTKQVELLFEWCTPSRLSLSSEKGQPPELRFVWGSNLQLAEKKFYLESVNVKYTMFGRTGNPLRATADIALKEAPTDLLGQNPTSGSIHARATHLISDGDTLQSIANKEYGNPNFWRGLAVFNDIDDPLRLTSGNRILLPSADEAAEISKN